MLERITAQLEAACLIDNDFSMDHFDCRDPHSVFLEDAKMTHVRDAVELYGQYTRRLPTPLHKFKLIEKLAISLQPTGRLRLRAHATSYEHIPRGGPPFSCIIEHLECVCVIAEMFQPAPGSTRRDPYVNGKCPLHAFKEMISLAHVDEAGHLYDTARLLQCTDSMRRLAIERQTFDRLENTTGVAHLVGRVFARTVQHREDNLDIYILPSSPEA